jgi:gliding motility-associated-like protein
MFPRKPLPNLLLVLAIFTLTSRLNGQVVCTPVYINEYKGVGGGPVQPHAVKALADGTMLVAGRASTNGAATYDGFVSRHAADGTPMWSVFLGGTGNDDLTGITQLNDGTFMLYGSTASFGHPEGKGWLVRIDGTGAVLWSGQLGSTITSTDRIKAIQQYADGDIVGTLNTNDSSAASDPVVFKIGLDGTIRWTHRFDNGNDDSFTTLAVSGDTLYAGGYYTAGGMLHGVITELDATAGTQLLSRNINNGDATLNEQVTSLEIYNNVISYGLYVDKGIYSYNGGVNGIYVIQTDLAGNTRSVAYDADQQGLSQLKCKRSADSGFYVLRVNDNFIYASSIAKIDWYGNDSWNLDLNGTGIYASPQTVFSAFDLTPDGGVVAAGHYPSYAALFDEVLRLVKITDRGEAASCGLDPYITYTNPSSFSQAAFSWASEPAFSPMATFPAPVSAFDPLTGVSLCSSSVCVDHTPIPSGCGKTYNIQYTSVKRSLYRDIMPLADGGRVAVGDLGETDGLVTRFQSNGDILWTKNYNIAGQVMEFRRILLTTDGNILVIGNNYYDVGNYAYRQMVLLKLDLNGNIIWCHFTIMGDTEMSDAVATPDNGFVVSFNEEYGGPGYPWLARFDANATLVWKKLVTHGAETENFKAIACSQDAVFVAYDSYDQGNYDKFGVDRLDLATGSLVYSKFYSAGSNTQAIVHSVFTIRDSAYVFAYVFAYLFAPTVTNLMVALDQQGNQVRSLYLGNDPVDPTPPAPQTWIDAAPPSVTLTPDLDFWLASRVKVSGAEYLEVTRIKPDGTVELSKLHTGISGYLPFNVRPQGKGLAVVGIDPAPTTGDADFINSFVLKLDSSGQLQAGAAANCAATDRPFAVTTCTACVPANFNYGPPATSDGYALTNTTGSPYNQNNDQTPVLYCFQPGNCNSVTMKQKGAACAVNDTLVFYLDNSGNCGAAATWSYDPSFFQPAHISGDSIQLIVQKAGSTTIGAQVEGYCSFTSQTKPTTIVLGSLTGLGLAADTVICSNGPISLQATPGYASYLWSDNSTASSLQVAAPGTYSLVATDLCGHTHDGTVQVSDANAAFHVTPDTIKCNQDVDPLRATSGYSNYQWSPTYNLQPQANMAIVSPDVNTTYTVTAQLSPGCTVTASTLVTVLSSPPISFGNDTSICSGDSLLLDGGPGFVGYLWNTGATAEQIYVHDPGTYALAAAYSNGCASRDTFDLVGLYDPHPALDSNAIFCVGQDRMLNAGSFSSYLWNDGSTGASFTVADTGTYWVTVTDSHGCIGSDTVHVLTIAQPPKGFLPQDTTICQYGDLVLATRVPFDSYTWSDLSAAATFTVKQPGTYWVEVTDKNGCTASDTVSIAQKYCLVGLFVPNAFTPDGNGSNDRFRPLVYGQVELLDFAVFDRFGQRVFETQTPLQGWDGRIAGSPAPAGAYVWFCRYRYPGDPAKMEKGTVILLR